jgi:class 3 adenylate cyclase
MVWNRNTSLTRIRASIEATKNVEIREFTREMTLSNIGIAEAYRVNGVHGYFDIYNAKDLLGSTETEGERSHQRYLRYLHIFSRVVHQTVLADTEVFKVDQQNERLHLLQFKPYDDEAKRIAKMVSTMRALRTLLGRVDDLHSELEDARVCVGVETGIALAVNNGTRGDREPLFLGYPANHAAKLLRESPGIYLGTKARACLGEGFEGDDSTKLTDAQLDTLDERAGLGLDIDAMVKRWKDELEKTPIASVEFIRPTPPLSGLVINELTPKNSRRFDGVAFMADIDGFTKFVSKRIDDNKNENEAVQVLHVIRKELRDVLNDRGGRKVRYLGDCLQGATLEGERTTDEAKTVEVSMDIVAEMRSSFALVHGELPTSKDLGLAIGAEFGPLSITRIGVKTDRDRCIAGRALLEAEQLQEDCTGVQSAFGPTFRKKGDAVAKKIFELEGGKIDALDVNKLEALRKDARGRLGGSSGGGSGGGGSSNSLPVKPHSR